MFHCTALICLAALAQTLPDACAIIQDQQSDAPFANDALLYHDTDTNTTSLTAVTLSRSSLHPHSFKPQPSTPPARQPLHSHDPSLAHITPSCVSSCAIILPDSRAFSRTSLDLRSGPPLSTARPQLPTVT